jgi:hypothetical protein
MLSYPTSPSTARYEKTDGRAGSPVERSPPAIEIRRAGLKDAGEARGSTHFGGVKGAVNGERCVGENERVGRMANVDRGMRLAVGLEAWCVVEEVGEDGSVEWR